MNNDYLTNVMQGATASSNLTQLAKQKDAGKVALLENQANINESISGGLVLGGTILGKATGLSEPAAAGIQAAGKAVGQRLATGYQNVRNLAQNVSRNMNPPDNPASNVQDSILEADPEDGVSGLDAVGGSTATEIGTELGAEAGADAVADTIGASLTASGIGAPIGAVILVGSALATGITGLVDLFKSHHQSPTKPNFSAIPQAMLSEGVYQ